LRLPAIWRGERRWSWNWPSRPIGDLRGRLAAEFPALAPLAPHLMFAIDADYVTDRTAIPPGADIAGIPPVSGG
jgi:molybdopterin converting factor small subunit